jgi:hypothetical protein
LLAAGRLGGSVQVLDGGAGTQVASWQAAGEQRNVGSPGTARVVGVHFLGSLPPGNGLSAADAAAAAHLRALSVTAGGRVSLHTAVAGAQAAWEQSSSFQAAPSVACSVRAGLNRRCMESGVQELPVGAGDLHLWCHTGNAAAGRVNQYHGCLAACRRAGMQLPHTREALTTCAGPQR